MLKNMKILIVDDNQPFRQNLQDILELKGYQVVLAGDGFEALDIVQSTPIDLVIMDIKMPVMNGVEVYKKLKETHLDLPVILMTAFAVEELIRESLQEGAFAVLKKPLNFEKLFTAIENSIPNGLMILIADDDENLSASISDVLAGQKYKVKIVHDGQDAVECVHENQFDILLLDMKLPVLNGFETYLRIKDVRPNLVVIIITGFIKEMDDIVQKVMNEGAYVCLEKPVKMEDLIILLNKIEQEI